jgi:RIO kinase 1
MKIEYEDNQILEKRFRKESDRKIFAKVFDKQTLDTIHDLAQKGHFDVIEHIISTGKEAHVFAATDLAGKTRAVKIYKKETTDFKRMSDYIAGDHRFGKIKMDIRNLINAWAKKEFKNLLEATHAKLNAPLPLAFKNNIVVMEFIGENSTPAPRLKETNPTMEELENYYEQTIDFIVKYYMAGLVHSDLSEYNILVKEKKLWFIDFAQAVITSHPKSKEFFERDVLNMSTYFAKKGIKTNYEKMYSDIKERKKEIEKNKKTN